MPNQTPFVDLSDKMTVREAARYADCHQETVKRWLREGSLSGQKIGLVWYIDVTDLRSYLDRKT